MAYAMAAMDRSLWTTCGPQDRTAGARTGGRLIGGVLATLVVSSVVLEGEALPAQKPLKNRPPTAQLRALARRELPHWVELDASRSTDKDGRIESYIFWMGDRQSGKLVRGPIETDQPRRGWHWGRGGTGCFWRCRMMQGRRPRYRAA